MEEQDCVTIGTLSVLRQVLATCQLPWIIQQNSLHLTAFFCRRNETLHSIPVSLLFSQADFHKFKPLPVTAIFMMPL